MSSGNERPNPPAGADELTPANTKRQSAARVIPCEHCRAEFTARRPWTRFCCANCRRTAWLERNPDKAAELARRDRARLRTHIVASGGTWVEREVNHGA